MASHPTANCRRLPPGISNHIGPFIAIHFHRDEVVVDVRCNLGIFVRLPIHDVAPMTPYCADIQQNRLVLSLSTRKGGFAQQYAT